MFVIQIHFVLKGCCFLCFFIISNAHEKTNNVLISVLNVTAFLSLQQNSAHYYLSHYLASSKVFTAAGWSAGDRLKIN